MMPFANIVFGFWIETVEFDRKDKGIRQGPFLRIFQIASLLQANPTNLSLWAVKGLRVFPVIRF